MNKCLLIFVWLVVESSSLRESIRIYSRTRQWSSARNHAITRNLFRDDNSNGVSNPEKRASPSAPAYEIWKTDYVAPEPLADIRLRWYLLPFLTPFVGFISWDTLSQLTHDSVILLGQQNWVAVDGGQYSASILAPAINGIVVPTISIALATLVAGTIAALRERQAIILSCINKEACALRMLCCTLDRLFRCDTEGVHPKQRDAMMILYKYITSLLGECTPTNNPGRLSAVNHEILLLLKHVYSLEKADTSIVGTIASILNELNRERSTRLSALQNRFPLIHWAVVVLLGLSVLCCFLLETDQEALKFLDDIQLRMTFGFLIGAVSSTGLLCFDLGEPFRGYFCISKSVQQLVDIRSDIERTLLADLDFSGTGGARSLQGQSDRGSSSGAKGLNDPWPVAEQQQTAGKIRPGETGSSPAGADQE